MYKKILTLGLALAVSFAFAASSFAADNEQSSVGTGIITAEINPLMANADANNPTGVRGQTDVKIASFNIIALRSRKGVSVNKIVLKNNADKNFALAKDFQNLKLKHNGVQIAPTIAVLSSWASAKYVFIPSTTINILPRNAYTVDVYADSLTNTLNVNRTYSAVSLDKLAGINLFTGFAVGWGAQYNLSGEADVAGQNIYIAPNGSLRVNLAANAPDAGNIVMNKTQTLAIFQFSAGSEEDVIIANMVITDSLSGITARATGSIVNLKILDYGGAQIGNTVVSMNSGSSSSATASFNGINYIIPKGQSRFITLVGDINNYPNAVSGSIHKFGILSAGDITAVGLTSAQIVSVSGAPVSGNNQTIYRSELTVVNAMNGMIGGSGGPQQRIARYGLTNSSPGDYSITVSNINLGIKSTIDNKATTTVKLYKDYPWGTPIAEKVFVGGADFSSINNWDSFTPFRIDAANGYGYTDIFVDADIWAAPTNMISTSIDAVTWSDGISQSNNIDNAPIIGATFIY